MAEPSRKLWRLGPSATTIIVGILIFFGLSSFLSFVEQHTMAEDRGTLHFYLVLLAITGAMGGVIFGLLENPRVFRFLWPDEMDRLLLRCGSLADGVIGIGGAWGVFLILGRSLQLGTRTDDILVLIGLGIVAGYGARRLLQSLGDRLEKMVQENREIVEEAKKKVDQTVPYVDYGDIEVITTIFDTMEGLHSSSREGRSKLLDLLEKARQLAADKVQSEPNSYKPYYHLARIKKRRALIADPEEKNTLLDEALALCDQALKIAPNEEVLYYNRAGYRALRHLPIQDVIADMRSAINLDPQNKERFKHEPDLTGYPEHPQIKELLT